MELDGLPGGKGLNIAHEAVDRHASGARADQLALRCLGKRGERARLHLRGAWTRDEPLRERARAASGSGGATSSACSPGASRSSTSRRSARSRTAASFCPLFSAFGPEPIRTRLELGNAKVLVTTELLYERKVAALRESLATARARDPRRRGRRGDRRAGDARLPAAPRRSADDAFEIAPTDPEDIALVHFTSGTTGHAEGRRPRPRGGRRRTTSPASSRSTSTRTTSSGARPTRAGSPAPRTGSSRRSRTA